MMQISFFEIKGIVFSGCNHNEGGSAVRVEDADTRITNCTFRDNISSDKGGALRAIFPDSASYSIIISESYFINNTAK